MEIGYARVSTLVQTLDLQTDALSQAGCELIFSDTVSGAKADRKGLAEAFSHLRPGDTLVVWRLDRLGRTLPHLIQTVEDLKARGIGFKSLTESIDTTTSAGQLIFHIFGALAEFERNLIREQHPGRPGCCSRSGAGRWAEASARCQADRPSAYPLC